MKRWAIVAFIAAGLGLAYFAWRFFYVVVDRTDYLRPPPLDELVLVDDRLEDKNPTFDPDWSDSRPLGDWRVNQSAAVVRLDCPMLRPDRDEKLLVLRPSYQAAVQAAGEIDGEFLPSANLIDGAAKQFDDGLYAALDLAAFQGELGLTPAAPEFVQAVFDKLPADSAAAPFLAAALKLSARQVDLPAAARDERDRLLAEFEADQVRSKPIGFYTWSPELFQVWRFHGFLQREFVQGELAVPREIAAVLANDKTLRGQYAALIGFYARLTNPAECLSVESLIGAGDDLAALANRHDARRETVAVVPSSSSRETELFDQVFANSAPAGTTLMARLIHAIRSGEVDLKPSEKDGWYQHQVYALETLLLPSRGQEEQRLLLTASYKRRLIEAFQALVTKRRETHNRFRRPKSKRGPPPGSVKPRLRVEPCPTVYLRTARAYALLQKFLLATVGRQRLEQFHGLRKGGPREPNLAQELESIRRRYYGFYLVACEDIGLRPQWLEDEHVGETAAKKAALAWLNDIRSDPDLARDTRVCVPILNDPQRRTMWLWATLGVRLARLQASYARPPKLRPNTEAGDWREPETDELGDSHYLIAVDEFAEIKLPGSFTLTREELRSACDKHKTKEAIVQALSDQ